MVSASERRIRKGAGARIRRRWPGGTGTTRRVSAGKDQRVQREGIGFRPTGVQKARGSAARAAPSAWRWGRIGFGRHLLRQPAAHAEGEQIAAAQGDCRGFGGGCAQGRVERGKIGGIGGEAAGLAGGEVEVAMIQIGGVEGERLAGEQVPDWGRGWGRGRGRGGGGEAGGGPDGRLRAIRIEVDECEQRGAAVGVRGAENGEAVTGAGLDERHGGTRAKGGMDGEEGVEAGDGGDLVDGRVPSQGGRAMHVESGCGKPFDTGGDAECPLLGDERGERGAHAGPGFTAGREAVVVVRFGKMDQRSGGFGTGEFGRKLTFERGAIFHLERFRVGPVEVGIGEEQVGDFDFSAEALEEKDRFREGFADASGDIAPNLGGNHIAGVAAEAVDALAAPEQEDIGHERAKPAMGEVEFDEIGPDDAPRARRLEGAVGGASEPFGVVGEERRCPAGVVGRDVEKKTGAAGVDGIRQLAELIDRCGAGVEFGQRRVDVEEIARGEGRAVEAHAGEGGRDGVDGEELDDSEAHRAEDGVEFADQIAEGAGWGDDGVALGEQGAGEFRVAGRVGPVMTGGAELPDKGRVDGVGTGGVGRGDFDDEVVAVGPFRDVRAFGNEARFSGEPADLGEAEGEGVATRAEVAHGDVVPVTRQRGLVGLGGGDDLTAAEGGVAEVGAEYGAAVSGARQREGNGEGVACELEQACTGRRMLLERHG